jgi:hypothetical protein
MPQLTMGNNSIGYKDSFPHVTSMKSDRGVYSNSIPKRVILPEFSYDRKECYLCVDPHISLIRNSSTVRHTNNSESTNNNNNSESTCSFNRHTMPPYNKSYGVEDCRPIETVHTMYNIESTNNSAANRGAVSMGVQSLEYLPYKSNGVKDCRPIETVLRVRTYE